MNLRHWICSSATFLSFGRALALRGGVAGSIPGTEPILGVYEIKEIKVLLLPCKSSDLNKEMAVLVSSSTRLNNSVHN